METKRKKIILIDGNAIIHRSYHAIPPLTTKKGELVNAVYGFASTLLSVIEKFQPEYIVASFDLKAPTFRHKKFTEYKATRKKAPDDLYQQIDRVKELVKTFNIPIYEREGFEADDIIGTMSRIVFDPKDDLEVIIVTGDLDSLQLVNEDVKVYTMSRGISKAVLYDEVAVTERFGLKPEQLKDYKGLRGDVSDNIPGVKGIGEKTAVSLLQEYGNLEGVYENIEKIKGANKKKLEDGKEMAFLSKELGTIFTKVELDFSLEKAKTSDFVREDLVKLFQELNFFSLIKRIPGKQSQEEKKEVAEKKSFEFEIVGSDRIDEIVKLIEGQKEVAISPEMSGDGISGVAFCFDKKGYFIETKNDEMKKLESVFSNKNLGKVGFDLKDIFWNLRKAGMNLEPDDFFGKNDFDVKIAFYLLNPGEKISFEKVVLEELGEEIDTKKSGQLSFGMESPEEIFHKVAKRSCYAEELKNILLEKLEKISSEQKDDKNLLAVFRKIEMPLVVILAEMEGRGVSLNADVLKEISLEVDEKISRLEQEIYDLAGEKFNINSPKQLKEILFEKLKISSEGVKKTKTGLSTAAGELEKMKGKHEIIKKISEYREVFKLKTTYLDTLPKMVGDDGRIHTTFNQSVTATGRLSSENPNLQNIPIKTDFGKKIRKSFEAEKGFTFVAADYSQIELRVMAHISGDEKLIEAFQEGEDIHSKTASEVHGVPIEEVTSEMRRSAKALNFGVIYGMGSYGFSQSAGIDQKEAKKYIDAYMKNFVGVASYIKNTKEFAKKNEYVENELGRRRYLPNINASNFQLASMAERMAVNMPAQGLAADIMKLAMLGAREEYKNNSDVKMILQIHDEIILEVKDELVESVAKRLKEIMESVYTLNVPLVADVEIGKNWGEV